MPFGFIFNFSKHRSSEALGFLREVDALLTLWYVVPQDLSTRPIIARHVYKFKGNKAKSQSVP